MNENMDKIDIYNNSAKILENKTPKSIISWITILCVLLFFFIVFSFVPFNIYKTYIGVLELNDNDYYFVTKLEYNDFPIDKSKKLYIKGKSYNYEVISIEDDILKLKIDLSDSLKTNNNALIINILDNRTTLFKIVLKKIKKGFGL